MWFLSLPCGVILYDKGFYTLDDAKQYLIDHPEDWELVPIELEEM